MAAPVAGDIPCDVTFTIVKESDGSKLTKHGKAIDMSVATGKWLIESVDANGILTRDWHGSVNDVTKV